MKYVPRGSLQEKLIVGTLGLVSLLTQGCVDNVNCVSIRGDNRNYSYFKYQSDEGNLADFRLIAS